MFPSPSRSSARRQSLVGTAPLLPALLLASSISSVGAEGVTIERPLDLGEWFPSGSPRESESPVCISGGTGSVLFRVVASGSSSGAGFTLDTDHGERLDYRVFWYAQGQGGGSEEMSAGVPSQQTVLADPVAQCAGRGAQSLIRVSIADIDLERALPGVYRGELVLTLSPL